MELTSIIKWFLYYTPELGVVCYTSEDNYSNPSELFGLQVIKAQLKLAQEKENLLEGY